MQTDFFSLTDNETLGSNATLVCKVVWSRCHDIKGGFPIKTSYKFMHKRLQSWPGLKNAQHLSLGGNDTR